MIGTLLNDRYEITAAIGKGAMGEVYRAVDKQTGADVAVKLMAGQYAFDADMVERFRREGEALRQLRHPNIVGLVDTFQHENRQVIVLEYVPGGALHELLKREAPLDIPRVKQIALDLCDALIRAHRLNIVHRDIKPENVLMAEDGTPRLTDFGVARLVGDATRLTGTGTQIGTPYYMSPEAWEGDQLDAQSDIWSLGVMLYEMLSGQVPFGGETLAAVMNKVLSAPLPDLRSARPEAPDGLAQIIERMVTRDRAARYQSMREVAADLERGRPLEAGKAPARPKPKPSRKAMPAPAPRAEQKPLPWRRIAVAAASVIALPILGAIVMAVFNLCPPAGPWPLPPWCPGSQFTWPFSTPAPTAAPAATFVTEGALGAVLFEDDFDGEPSMRWDFQPQRWETATVDGRTVLVSDTSQSSGFVSLKGEGWTDYAAQFDFKFLKPDEHNAYYFYLRFRATDCPPTVKAMDDYVVLITPDIVELRDESCETQRQEMVAQNDRNIGGEDWHTAQVIAIGNRVRLLIDGEQYFDYTDSESPHLDGGVTLDLENGVELAIDNFRVNEIIPGEAAAATPVPAYVTEGELGQVLFEDDFEDGVSPAWFALQPGWQAEVVDGRGVLRGAGPLDGNIAFITNEDWADFTLQTDFNFIGVSQTNNYHISIFARWDDCPPEVGWLSTYNISITYGVIELGKSTCDTPREWAVLESVEHTTAPREWHALQVTAVGNRIQVFLDGEQIIDRLDTASPILAGGAALVTVDGAEALFDNVRVTEIVPPTACAAGETQLFADDFEGGDLSDWSFQDENGAAAGPWSVATDDSNHVLVGSDHNWATMGGQWQNYTVTLRVKRLSYDNADVHINSHMSEGNRYYLIYPQGALKQDTPAAAAAQLGEVSFADDTEWHTLALSAADGRLDVRLDGESLGTLDGEALPAGGIGIENVRGSLWYDDVLVCGAAGGALHLDGASGYASVPFDDSLHLTQALTLEAWVNVESRAAKTCTDAGYCNFMPVIAQSNPSSSIGNYLLAVNAGKPLFGFEPVSIGDALWYGDAVIDGGWHHLAAVHTFGQSAETGLYLDGQPVAGTWVGDDQANQAAYTLAQSNYLIGYMTVGAEAYFAGLLDELRVWNVARTQAEIQAAMNGELTGSEAGLAGYWKFNESPGAATARDSSPNGNDASLEGSAEIRVSDAPVMP